MTTAKPTAATTRPPHGFRFEDPPERQPDDMTSFNHLTITGSAHYLLEHFGNRDTTLVAGEHYVSREPGAQHRWAALSGPAGRLTMQRGFAATTHPETATSTGEKTGSSPIESSCQPADAAKPRRAAGTHRAGHRRRRGAEAQGPPSPPSHAGAPLSQTWSPQPDHHRPATVRSQRRRSNSIQPSVRIHPPTYAPTRP